MLIDASNKIAIKCSDCGKYNILDFNTFKFKIPTSMFCSCGHKMCNVSINKNELLLKVDCIACETLHSYRFKLSSIMQGKIKIISCPVTGIEIAFLGKEAHVKDIIEKYDSDTAELLKCLETNFVRPTRIV